MLIQPSVVFRSTYEDEVGANISSTRDVLFLCTPQQTNVVRLGYEDNDPVYAGHYRVDAEPTSIVIILPPDRMTVMVPRAIARRLEGVQGSSGDQT